MFLAAQHPHFLPPGQPDVPWGTSPFPSPTTWFGQGCPSPGLQSGSCALGPASTRRLLLEIPGKFVFFPQVATQGNGSLEAVLLGARGRRWSPKGSGAQRWSWISTAEVRLRLKLAPPWALPSELVSSFSAQTSVNWVSSLTHSLTPEHAEKVPQVHNSHRCTHG